MSRFRLAAIAALVAAVIAFPAVAKNDPPILAPVATYDTELGANGAEIINVRDRDGLAVLTNIGGGINNGGSIDILNLADPANPVRIMRVQLDGVSPNSAAIHPQHGFFLLVAGGAGKIGRVEARRLIDGTLIDSAPVGTQPDSIAIAPSGQYAVVANEAEGTGKNNNGGDELLSISGDGSLSIVNLSGFTGKMGQRLVVTPVALPSQNGVPGFSTGRTDDAGRLSIDNTPATLEPESVAFSHDSRYAFVTLQENNGVVRLEVRNGELTFFGLGQTTHAADLDSEDGEYKSLDTLIAYREPDGIALDVTGKFFVTADEGDTRDANGNSGPRGGRTVSVFDAKTGAFIADTGDQLDEAAEAVGLYPDSRSERGGSEPEVLDLTHARGFTLVAVGLERANAVALIDVSDPATPAVIDIVATGAGPEGVKFLHRHGRLYLTTANEVAGTVSIFEVLF